MVGTGIGDGRYQRCNNPLRRVTRFVTEADLQTCQSKSFSFAWSAFPEGVTSGIKSHRIAGQRHAKACQCL